MSERIILGSGSLYVTQASAPSDGVYSIPTDAQLETAANRLGYIKGGATLEYNPEYYTVKDDLGLISKTYLTEEEATFKTGILTWDKDVLAKLVATEGTTASGTISIGGKNNFAMTEYVIRFVYSVDGETERVTIVGHNESGFEIQFNPETETVINAEFKAVPGCGTAGCLVKIDEATASASE